VGFLCVKLAKDRLDQTLVLIHQFRFRSLANKRVFHAPLLAARSIARRWPKDSRTEKVFGLNPLATQDRL
jgi:hypothetical protein